MRSVAGRSGLRRGAAADGGIAGRGKKEAGRGKRETSTSSQPTLPVSPFPLPASRDQHVADATHRVQHRLVALRVELSPEICDIHVDDIGSVEIDGGLSPNLSRDGRATQGAPGVSHEIGEQCELTLREHDLTVAAEHLVRYRIEHDVSDAETRRVAVRIGSAQEGAHARYQLVGVERLREIIVGARIEAGDSVADLGAGSEHERRCADALSPELLHNLESVALGKADVEDEQVGFTLERGRQSLLAIVNGLDRVPVLVQHTAKEVDDVATVFHDENRGEVGCCMHRWVKLLVGHRRASGIGETRILFL